MRSQASHRGAAGSTLTPALLEEIWPVARERLVSALGAHGVADTVAEEAVAEAATRALGRQLAVADVDDFCRWAFVVARNVAHDTTRRSRRTILVDAVPDRPDDYDLTQHVEVRERWRLTAAAIEGLSAADRTALLHELDPAERVSRRESVKQAVRRHRARARLRHVLGQLGGWLGWLKRPWLWPAVPHASLEGLAALALLPLLATTSGGVAGPAGAGDVALPVVAAERQSAAPSAIMDVRERRAPSRASVSAAGQGNGTTTSSDESPDGWRYEFTASPSYEQDHTVFSSGNGQLFVSRDGGATWQLLPARGRENGRILLPPSYPRDPRIFSSSTGGLSVSTDDGETFHLVAATTGPAAISPLFAAGDPRILLGSDRNLKTPLPLQYRDDDGSLAPLQLPMPTTAAVMELWFGNRYAEDGRMFVGAIEAPRLVEVGTDGARPRIAFTIPALYTCVPDRCERVVDFGLDILPPMLTSSPKQPDTVFVGTTHTLHRSTDGGTSFQQLRLPGVERRHMLSALVAGPDGRLYAKVGSSGLSHLYASDDGETWEFLREVPEAFANLAVLPDGKLIEGQPFARGGGVRCSVDGGRTWSDPCSA